MFDGLLNCLFRHKSQKTSKHRVTGLCEGNSPVTGELPSQMATNAVNVTIWWRHHEMSIVRMREKTDYHIMESHCIWKHVIQPVGLYVSTIASTIFRCNGAGDPKLQADTWWMCVPGPLTSASIEPCLMPVTLHLNHGLHFGKVLPGRGLYF